MLKKFVAIVALMAMFIVTGCTAPVEEAAPLITADDGPEMIDTSDVTEPPVEGEEVSDETLEEEISDEIVGEELEGEQITAEDSVGIPDELLVTPALPAIPTPVIPAVITPEIVIPVVDPLAPIDPVDVDGMIIPAASAEVVLAQCLTANGAKLYTASWCGHCQNQKAAFLDGVEYIDHTECAVDDGWAKECKDAEIESVPTWVFADGTTKSGNTPLADLADRADCIYE
jgi:hypothetical protein